MPIFLFESIIAGMVYYLTQKQENSRKCSFFIMTLLLLTIFHGLRYDTTTDYLNYFLLFQKIRDGVQLVSVEPAYVLLNKLFCWSKDGYIFVILVSSFVSIFVASNFLKSYNVLKFGLLIAFSLQFYIMINNQIRQSIAMSIFWFLAYKYKFNNWKVYFIGAIIAASFHTSALIIIPFYFIGKYSQQTINKNFIVAGSCVAPLILFSGVASNMIISLFSLTEHYSRFIGSEYSESFDISSIGLIFLFRLFLLYYVLLNKKYFTIHNIVLYNMTYFTLVLYCIFGTIPVAERLVRYIYIFEYAAIAIIIQGQIKNKKSLPVLGLLILLYVHGVFSSYKDYQGGIYKTVFSDDCQNHIFYNRIRDNVGNIDRSDYIAY